MFFLGLDLFYKQVQLFEMNSVGPCKRSKQIKSNSTTSYNFRNQMRCAVDGAGIIKCIIATRGYNLRSILISNAIQLKGR